MSDTGSGTAAPTIETSSDGRANGEPVVRAEGVWKVFGPHGDRLVGTPDAELPPRELRQKTGCVADVRDV